MINKCCIVSVFLMVLFSNQIHYWSLGVSIGEKTIRQKTIVQKEIDLNNLVADKPLRNNNSEAIYTLKTNYFIEPQAFNNTDIDIIQIDEVLNIKSLILKEEYLR